MSKKNPFSTGLQEGIYEILTTQWRAYLGSSRNYKKFPPPSQRPPFEELLKRLKDNIPPTSPGGRGVHYSAQKNWRFEIWPDCESTGEKLLEKKIAEYNPTTSANQVPTCSGYSSGYDGKRAIDLVESLGHERFKFIELKTNAATNTPIYAASEVLLYGLTYLLARQEGAEWKPKPEQPAAPQILKAHEIQLVVLAPPDYYDGDPVDSLREFEHLLSTALGEYVAANAARFKEPALTMSFAFEVLGEGLNKSATHYTKEEIARIVAGIRRHFPRSEIPL